MKLENLTFTLKLLRNLQLSYHHYFDTFAIIDWNTSPASSGHQSINRNEAHGEELIKLLKHLPFEGISARVSDGEAVIISSTADRVLIMSATAAKRPLAWPWDGRGRARARGRMLGAFLGWSWLGEWVSRSFDKSLQWAITENCTRKCRALCLSLLLFLSLPSPCLAYVVLQWLRWCCGIRWRSTAVRQGKRFHL